MNKLYTALKILRKRAGYTQQDIAIECLSISINAYQAMESGKRDTLTVANLYAISEYIGIDPISVLVLFSKLRKKTEKSFLNVAPNLTPNLTKKTNEDMG